MAVLKVTGAVTKYPARFALAAYLLLILAGALALLLPVCHADSARPFSLLDATFMSTSAVCVTGLSVRSVEHDFSLIGQVVLLGLVQLGGIGIITVTTLATLGIVRRGGLRRTLAVAETLGSRPTDNVAWVLRTAMLIALSAEALGFIVLFLRNLVDMSPGHAAWHALFHAVSAFCNAGFTLSDSGLMAYQSDLAFNLTIGLLIIVGGIGFPVWLELARRHVHRRRRELQTLSLHTRLVLLGTAGLLVTGMLSVLLLESDNVLEGRGWGDRLLIAFFHSTSCRTAGFHTVDLTQFTAATLFISVVLMTIGASPCSTGGGLKVTTMMVLGLLSWNRIRGFRNPQFAYRRISEDLIDRSVAVVLLYLLVAVVALTAVLSVEATDLPHAKSRGDSLDALFEVVSALSTVGLSSGFTAECSETARVLLIILMIFGRLGPISIFIAISRSRRDTRIEYAREDVLIG